MSSPENLNDLYIDELKDLWSANDQMQRCIKKLLTKASDNSLKEMLTRSQQGISQHTDMLKELIGAHGQKVSKEHCKGMQGLVAEAIKHTTEEAPKKGPVMDVVIIAQYQRMTHYGIAGFGTASAFAKALGNKQDHAELKAATKGCYRADEYMTKLAETSTNMDAKDE